MPSRLADVASCVEYMSTCNLETLSTVNLARATGERAIVSETSKNHEAAGVGEDKMNNPLDNSKCKSHVIVQSID